MLESIQFIPPQNKEAFKQDIIHWMTEFVEKPQASLNGWPPCPYARKARLNNKVFYSYSSPDKFLTDICDYMGHYNDQYDVYVLGTDPSAFALDEFHVLKDRVRKTFQGQDIWALFDHPSEIEMNKGLCFNNGKYLLAMIQRLSKLNQASDKLKSEGYYDDWDPQYLEKLFSSRVDAHINKH
jgi:hypothetical protein